MLALNSAVAVPCGAGCSLGLSSGVLTLLEEIKPGDCAQKCKYDNVISILHGQGLSSNGQVFGYAGAGAFDHVLLRDFLRCVQDTKACPARPKPEHICTCSESLWRERNDPDHIAVVNVLVVRMTNSAQDFNPALQVIPRVSKVSRPTHC